MAVTVYKMAIYGLPYFCSAFSLYAAAGSVWVS